MEHNQTTIKRFLDVLGQIGFTVSLRLGKHFKENRTRWIISTIVFLLLAAILWPWVFVTIHAGQAGIYYQRFGDGTIVNKVYGEGFYVVAPWDILTIYNVRFQTNT